MLESDECPCRRIMSNVLHLKRTSIVRIGRQRSDDDIGSATDWESSENLSEEVVKL